MYAKMALSEILHWLGNHWENLLTLLGVGGGSGVIAQKITHRREWKQIKELEDKVEKLENSYKNLNTGLTSLKNEVQVNTAFDKQFRAEVDKQHLGFKDDLKEVKGRLDQILQHLLNQK